MRALIRTLLICLLALALPAQAVAAATMAYCTPNHPAAGLTVAALHGTEADLQPDARHQELRQHQARHVHGTSTQAGKGHDGHPADGVAAQTPSAATDLSAAATFLELAHAEKHQCSACASCCAAAAVSSIALGVPAPGVTRTVFIAVVPAVEKFAADGLDRPPRAILV